MAQLYPFTDPLVAKKQPPKAMVSGEGCWVVDRSGRRYLDAVSGLWCVSLGFSNERLIRAAERQYRNLPYYHSFMGRTAEATERLAEALTSVLPAHINRVFFGCSGSDAVETAAKLVRFYWNARGAPEKKKIIARDKAYHGSLSASAALTGMDYCHDGFDLPGPDVLRIGRPSFFHDAEPGESEQDFAKRRARELEDTILAAGADKIGAFIGEPVVGSGGVFPPPDGYWQAVQEVLKRHDILLIADEIITGFGRTGAWFASDKYGLTPDLMTTAKQLSSAYFPISAVGISDRVAAVIDPHAHDLGTLGHGLTYGGHPVGCAVALETLAIYQEMDLPATIGRLAERLSGGLEALRDHPAIVDIRYSGFMAGVELAVRVKASEASAEVERQGVLLRVIDNTLAISPPYVISDQEIDLVLSVLRESIDAVVARQPLREAV